MEVPHDSTLRLPSMIPPLGYMGKVVSPMPEAHLVKAWRLGYAFGRMEAESECACQGGLNPPPDNVFTLDNYRIHDQKEKQ